jgi:hypothetical protein
MARQWDPYHLFTLQDPSDKIKSRLCFSKLQDLLGDLKECRNCKTIFVDNQTECFCAIPTINAKGEIDRCHFINPQFDINDWILKEYLKTKSWQEVFIKVWGHCNTFRCCYCNQWFDLNSLYACRAQVNERDIQHFTPFLIDLSPKEHKSNDLIFKKLVEISCKSTIERKYEQKTFLFPEKRKQRLASRSKLNGYQKLSYVQRELDVDQIGRWMQDLNNPIS